MKNWSKIMDEGEVKARQELQDTKETKGITSPEYIRGIKAYNAKYRGLGPDFFKESKDFRTGGMVYKTTKG